jgi:hypothetical protein
MTTEPKITPAHLRRRAVVYVRQSSEGQVMERRVAPVLPRLGLVRNRDLEVVDLARRRAETRHDAIAQRWVVGEDRLEARPRITRRREDRERDGVERKDPAAAAARLDLLLHRRENGVNDLERLARDRPHESANGAIECAGQPGFEVACFSQ